MTRDEFRAEIQALVDAGHVYEAESLTLLQYMIGRHVAPPPTTSTHYQAILRTLEHDGYDVAKLREHFEGKENK